MDNPNLDFQQAPAESDMARVDGDMQRLRELIFGLEYQQLITLKTRLENWRQRADDVAEVLPRALHTSVKQSPALVSELTGVIEQAMQASVRQNPQALVDAIFPVLGPAIRKAIRTTLQTMLQSLNQTIEQGLSVRALTWRFGAWRSGKSYAEYLLLKTMIFQVEQVFLIHNETGLLLQHTQAEHIATKDPDMISGMLSAIQDFVRDSFQGEESDNLESMQFGHLTVMLEAGPDTAMALVVSGEPPTSLREKQIEVVEEFQLRYAHDLTDFDGDTSAFNSSTDLLQGCLVSQRRQQAKDTRSLPLWRAWLLIASVLLVVCYWQYGAYAQSTQWQLVLETLRAEPGVIVVNASERHGVYNVELLKDPLARDPEAILRDKVKFLERVNLSYIPFISLERRLILERAVRKLQPPADIELSVEDGVLHLTGTAEKQWLDRVALSASDIVGVDDLDYSAVRVRVRDEEVADLESKINGTRLYFDRGKVRLDDTGRQLLTDLAAAMIRLEQILKQQGSAVKYMITGHSDLAGTDVIRQKVSDDRARTAYGVLLQHGVNIDSLRYAGVGTKDYRNDMVNSRRVSFRVVPTNDGLSASAQGG